MYNPLTDKKPYGATVVGKETTIKFPLNTSLGVKRVFVVLRRIFGEGGQIEGEPKRYELSYRGSENGEDIFVGAFALNEWGIWKYRFEGELTDGQLAFFGRDMNGCAIRGDWLPEWQLTVTKEEYKTPNWAKQGVIYQIFADRFCKGEDRPFKKTGRLHTNWYDKPDFQVEGKDYFADDFFGGNIEGIIQKLDYLKSLGVSCIYLSPIFKSSSNHRYDTGDYLQIDELFGDEEQFATLIKKAGEFNINVMLDGVFNHTGSDSLYFNKDGNYPSVGAYQSKESPYYDWYIFNEYPNKYHCWWGCTNVPTVNKQAQGYRQLILGENGVIKKWTKFGVKAWRLDVVDELPVEFTEKLCSCIRESGEDIFVVGEVWEDATTKIAYSEWKPYFVGGQLDAVMNYPFKQSILTYALNGDVGQFVSSVTRILENYPKQSLDTLMNLIDSHDTVRALTMLSGAPAPHKKSDRAKFELTKPMYEKAKQRLKLASVLQYTLPGVPCLYYGDEAGVQGFEDPLNRGTYPWGREDKNLVEHYKKLGEMRAKYAEVLQGETHFVNSNDMLIFERVSDSGILRVEAMAPNVKVLVNGEIIFEV